MKLISCHIENFGRFHNYDLDFSEGMNVFMEQNGWGKTTLTAFLKAMLYGFDRKSVKDITVNERLRYKPWQGGSYGGWLCFEVNDKAYTVNRTFGATGSSDTVKVTDMRTGKISRDFGDGVGETIFKLDAGAFKKSVYITQNSLGNTDANLSIHARLNHVLGEASDVARYDDAIKSITERIKFFDKRGSNGQIAVITRQIDDLIVRIRAAKNTISQVELKRARIARIDDELKKLERTITDINKKISDQESKTKDIAAVRKVYDELCEKRESIKREIIALTPSTAFPTIKEIEQIRGALRQLEQRLEEVKQPTEELKTLEDTITAIEAKYPESVPTAKELQEIRALRAQLDKLLSEAEMDRIRQLDARIASLKLEIEKSESEVREQTTIIQNYTELCKQRDDLIAQCTAINSELESQPTAQTMMDIQKKLAQLDQLRNEVNELERQLVEPQRKRNELSKLYPGGVPTDSALTEVIALEAEISASEKKLTLSADEESRRITSANRKDELESIFKTSVPDISKLEDYRDQLNTVSNMENRLSQARTERAVADSRKNQISEEKKRIESATLPVKPESSKTSSGIAALWFILAAAAVAGAVFVNPFVGAVAVLFLILGIVAINRTKNNNRAIDQARNAYEETVRKHEEELHTVDERYRDADEEASKLAHFVNDLENEITSVYERIMAYVRKWAPQVRKEDLARECTKLIGLTEEWLRISDVIKLAEEYERETTELSTKKHTLSTIIAGYPYAASGTTIAARMQLIQRDGLLCRQLDSEIGSIEKKLTEKNEKYLSVDSEVKSVMQQYGMDADRFDATIERLSTKRAEQNAIHKQVSEAKKKTEEYADRYSAIINRQETENKTVMLRTALESAENDRAVVVGSAIELTTIQTVEDYEELVEITCASEQVSENYQAKIHECWKKLVRMTLLLPDAFATLDEVLQEADADAAAYSKTGTSIHEKHIQVKGIQGKIDKLRQSINEFVEKYEVDADDLNDELERFADAITSKQNAQSRFDELDKQIKQYEKKYPELTRPVTIKPQDAPAELQSALQEAVDRKDELRKERTQYEEGIRYSDQAVAAYRELEQQMNVLVEQRQKAQKSLSILHKSAELLRTAKENLANRYIGQISSYFNRYLSVIDQNGALSGEIDSEFNVTMREDGIAHQAQGYSTGYCDIIDLCMRLALVDTLFESERPFIIMDDPFVNLDEKHLEFSVSLLNRLASETQIIYFACHPSRHTDLAVAMDFDIKKLKRTKKAKSTSTPKTPVVPRQKYPLVTEPAIRPAVKKKITNNIFSLEFVADSIDATTKDFEVFFVDETEHILCDTIQVSVTDGQVIPQNVRFCLNTGSAKGNTYMLMVRNVSREENEVASKIPFDVSLTFTADFDF